MYELGEIISIDGTESMPAKITGPWARSPYQIIRELLFMVWLNN